MRLVGRVAAWMAGIPIALAAVIYLVLLFFPIPLPFLNSQVRNLVMASMPAGSRIELGDMALALEGYVWPVIQFQPVAYTDAKTGARIEMDALEVGFSPIRALWGQPGATVTAVGPHIQVNQDIFGPRLVTFNVVPDAAGGPPTVQIIEGEDTFPDVNFSAEGVDVQGALPPSALQVRSDNDWLVYNLEAAEAGLASVIEQANLGRFSRMVVRNATLDMNDAVYGIFREFREINIDVAPSPDGKVVEGTFSMDLGGAVMNGVLERTLSADGKVATLTTAVTNLNLAALAPFDQSGALVSLVGAGAVSADINFDAETGKIQAGLMHLDLTGMDVRVDDDYIPLASNIMEVKWEPAIGQFTFAETQVSVGDSSGYLSGVVRMGLDELYGPVVSVAMQARDVSVVSELGAPEEPFSRIAFQGWSAPLYGATGIDGFRAEKSGGAWLTAQGRVDMLVRGMGVDMTIETDGVSADDVKRLWPYFAAPEGRDWFVKNVVGGELGRSTMRVSFPVGTMPEAGDLSKPLPKNSILVDMIASGIEVIPMEGMQPLRIDGETRLTMRDSNLTVAADGASLSNSSGSVAVANVGFTMSSDTPGENIFELSGDLSGSIPALVTFAKEQQPELLESAELPIDISALNGNLSLSLVSTTVMDAKYQLKSQDYAVNGVIQDFGSTAPLEGRSIGNGQLSFVASQQGYRVQGQAEIDGLPADVVISGTMAPDAPPPEMLLSATLSGDDIKKMGFDASEFMQGSIKFVAKPMPDKSLQIAVDLTDAALTIKDLGITKAKGVDGDVRAVVKMEGDLTEVSQLDIGFGDVKLEGSLGFDTKKSELQRAEFTSIALSPGDVAQMSLTPIRGGYQLRVRGDQLDLKPMLKRFFSLDTGSGGPQAMAFEDTTIALDIELERALGFFKTTAFNLDIDLALRGMDIQKASVSARFGGDSALSVTSNPTPGGKTMSVVFNDMGALLRLVGVYPNIQGGDGSLVLNTVAAEKADYGTFVLKNFAIVDEKNMEQLLEGRQQTRARASRSSDMEFKSAEVEFVRRKDRVEIRDAVLAGDDVGGSARGFIYTDQREYDIVGTYVPLFGLNNVFAKLMGPLAGRDGEGMFGITFQVKGPLDKPDFRINPMSALAPGAFRRMFEFRQREIPRTE